MGAANSPGAQTATAIDVSRLEDEPLFSVSDILRQSPGVSVKQGNGPRYLGISIRGSNARNGFGIRNIVIFDDGFPGHPAGWAVPQRSDRSARLYRCRRLAWAVLRTLRQLCDRRRLELPHLAGRQDRRYQLRPRWRQLQLLEQLSPGWNQDTEIRRRLVPERRARRKRPSQGRIRGSHWPHPARYKGPRPRSQTGPFVCLLSRFQRT